MSTPTVSFTPLAGLRNALLPDGALVDLTFTDGVVTAVAPAARAGAVPDAVPGDVLDLDGRLLLPAGVEPHTHLDKALSFDAIKPTYGGLADGIRQWQTYARTLDEDDFVRRGKAAALELLANGATAIRTHAEVFPSGDPLIAVRAMVRVRTELAGLLDLEIAVLAKNDVGDDLVEESIRLGADLVGGSPHNTPDPAADLARLLAIARRTRVGIDIHADERLDPRSLTVRDLAAAVAREPLAGTVSAGHCVSLGVIAEPLRSEVAAELAAAGVGVITCPVTNLYLQGRDHPIGMPRGLTATRALLDAGVTLAGAGDNIRDPLNPVGAADPLATAALLLAAGHLTVEESLEAVTRAGRVVMGLPAAGAFVGGVADFLAVRASTTDEAISRLMHDRLVIHAGALVARRTSELTVAGVGPVSGDAR